MDKQQHISALYEIAMSIGTSLNLQTSIKHTIDTYIRQLDCIGIIILRNQKSSLTIQYSKPKHVYTDREHKKNIDEIITSIDSIQKEFLTNNRVYIQNDRDSFYHLCNLENFGFMIVIKNHKPFEERIYRSLPTLHKKFSLAIQNCISDTKLRNQDKELKELNEHLETRVQKEISKNREKDELLVAQSRQAAMGEMISMIAHQWRQPITVIALIAQNIQLDIDLDEFDSNLLEQRLDEIVEQTHFLSHTIDDFRNFLKPNESPDSALISTILDGALSIIEKSLSNHNIEVEKSYQNDSLIYSFSNEIIQVLLNILNNAKDIIQTKQITDGKIVVTSDSDKNHAYLTIKDNGGGIPDDVLPKIFEPYFSTKEEKGGTGLGLYMSHMIVEKHLKGMLTAKNSGHGAIFTVILPLHYKKLISKKQ
jgi:signal transduction histidine kinase